MSKKPTFAPPPPPSEGLNSALLPSHASVDFSPHFSKTSASATSVDHRSLPAAASSLSSCWPPSRRSVGLLSAGLLLVFAVLMSSLYWSNSDALRPSSSPDPLSVSDYVSVSNLVESYRNFGHLTATVDPLGQSRTCSARSGSGGPPSTLSLSYYGWSSSQLDADISALPLDLRLRPAYGTDGTQGPPAKTIRELYKNLQAIYGGNVGFEVSNVRDPTRRAWLLEKIETRPHKPHVVGEMELLHFLIQSDCFARFVKDKTPDAYSFPMWGLNNELTAIKSLIRSSALVGIEMLHFGMHHRGRDEFMHNVMGIPMDAIFHYMDEGDGGSPVSSEDVCDPKTNVCYSGDSIYGMGTSAWLNVSDTKWDSEYGDGNDRRRKLFDKAVEAKFHSDHFMEATDRRHPKEVFRERAATSASTSTSAPSGSPSPVSKVWVSVSSNAAHLESNNPITAGAARALQDMVEDENRTRVMAVLISGDGSVAAQGIVEETKKLTSNIRGFEGGGMVHLVNNNQIAHTVDPCRVHSRPFPTDFAKVTEGPVFHANGDDPESVAYAVELAVEWRQTFHEDATVDVVGYRRQGHYGSQQVDKVLWLNGDLYDIINNHPTELQVYTSVLIERGVVTQDEVDALVLDENEQLEEAWGVRKKRPTSDFGQQYIWPFLEAPFPKSTESIIGDPTPVPANVSLEIFTDIIKATLFVDRRPEGFAIQDDLEALFTTRRSLFLNDTRNDCDVACGVAFGVAESLAIGTLLNEGFNVRLTGQDSLEGVDLKRMYDLHDKNTYDYFTPLHHLWSENPQSGKFFAVDSSLSELAVLGHELGYSIQRADDTLVLWDTHNGDFINNAQMIIDDYIVQGEVKWFRQTPLTMLLPMGYVACNGPEHTNIRLSRMLLLSDEGTHVWDESLTPELQLRRTNIVVTYPTTPANYFHFLRRQMHLSSTAFNDRTAPETGFRKPLAIVLPHTIVKDEYSLSRLSDLIEGEAQLVIDDDVVEHVGVRKVLICTGMVFQYLHDYRIDNAIKDVAIVRIEQLAPFPFLELAKVLVTYPTSAYISWVQEDPENYGAWLHVYGRYSTVLAAAKTLGVTEIPSAQLHYIGRSAAAAPAVGFCSLALNEREELMELAFSDSTGTLAPSPSPK